MIKSWIAFIAVCVALILNANMAVAQTVDHIFGASADPIDDLALTKAKVVRLGYDRLYHFYDSVSKTATPENMDENMLNAYSLCLSPMLMLTTYTTWEGEREDQSDILGYDIWYEAGRAFAERFRPNSDWMLQHGILDWGITHYTCFNEPDNRNFNSTPFLLDLFYDSVKGFADGVHSVDPSLKVSLHGNTETELKNNKAYCFAKVVPLYNDGTLDTVIIHRYWNEKYVPMSGRYDWSLQSQFDEVKSVYGLRSDVSFATTEFNVPVQDELTDEEETKRFLTAIWDALGVVGDNSKPVTQYALVYHLNKKDQPGFTLGESFSPWVPNDKGKVFQLVSHLSEGMEITDSDPKNTGIIKLEGGGKTLLVWQNRKAWSSIRSNGITINDIPSGTENIEIYRYNSWVMHDDGSGEAKPYRTINVSGLNSVYINNLPTEETLMFLLDVQNEKKDIRVENCMLLKCESNTYDNDIVFIDTDNMHMIEYLYDNNTSNWWESTPFNGEEKYMTLDIQKQVDVSEIELSIPPAWGGRTQTVSVWCGETSNEMVQIKNDMPCSFETAKGNKVLIPVDMQARYIKIAFSSNTAADRAQLSGLTVNQSGFSKISAAQEGETYRSYLNVSNYGSNTENVLIATAFYNKNTLVDVKLCNSELLPGKSYRFFGDKFKMQKDVTSVKIFLWNEKTQSPIIENYEISCN